MAVLLDEVVGITYFVVQVGNCSYKVICRSVTTLW